MVGDSRKKGQTGRHPFGENANFLGWKTLRLAQERSEKASQVKSGRGNGRERYSTVKPRKMKAREVKRLKKAMDPALI
jgi:hypothetical protein